MKKSLLLLFVIPFASVQAQVMSHFEKHADDQSFNIYKQIEIYNAALREVNLSYVDTIDYENLLKVSLNSMLYELDPYTQFFSESDNDAVRQMQSGDYGGIGSAIMRVDEKTYISAPSFGKPAFEAGLRAGDELLEVDGVPTAGKTISEVSKMLRGKPSTEITIKYLPLGSEKPQKVKFKRALIQSPSISYATADNGTGYIHVSEFVDHTYADFASTLAQLVDSSKIERLIIDLRSNGGGIVEQAVRVASLFLPVNTQIAYIKGPHSEYNYATKQLPLYPDMPLVIIVDEETASASEVLAGAMQDLDRAVVVGARTFGKGLVQNIRSLPHDSYIKITTAKYYLPSGRCVQERDYSKSKAKKYAPKEFRTRNGRKVYDGSGVSPDSLLKSDRAIDISYYLYYNNIYFKYANQFVPAHKTIAPPSQFALTDEEYEEFCQFVVNENFTYTLESNKYLANLKELVESEGYKDLTADIFEALSAVLQPNVANDLHRLRETVAPLLESELVRRYYYDWGEMEYTLRGDKWYLSAKEIISDRTLYESLLK